MELVGTGWPADAAAALRWWHGLACWPVFEVEESASPQIRRSTNQQQECAMTADAVLDRDHLMAVGPNRTGIATDLLRHNYRQLSTLYRTTTKIIKALPRHHAAMTNRSNLLAAVMPHTHSRAASFRDSRVGRTCPSSGDHLVTQHG